VAINKKHLGVIIHKVTAPLVTFPRHLNKVVTAAR